eukprot:576154-Prymnesium_polylepis.1
MGPVQPPSAPSQPPGLPPGLHHDHTHDTDVIVGTSSMLDSTTSGLSAVTTQVNVGMSPYYWSSIPASPSSYSIEVGDKLSFMYSEHHNVYLMASQTAYDSCDFTGATALALESQGGLTSSTTPNLYEAVATSAGTLYIACQVGSHCAAGQKITVTIAAPTSTSRMGPVQPPSAPSQPPGLPP